MVEHQQQIAIMHAEAKLAITKARGAVGRLADELHSGAMDGCRAAAIACDRATEMSAWVDQARDDGYRGLRIELDSRKPGEA